MKFPKHKADTSSDEQNEQEYAKLGKLLVRAIVRDNIKVTDRWLKFIGISFVRGLFMGLGSVIGATLLVAITLWLLNIFDSLPVIGQWLETLQEALQAEALLD